MHGRSLPLPAAAALPAGLQRTTGTGRVSIGRSGVREFYQEGALRLRLPHAAVDATEVVAINTAGGLTGGDAMSLSVTLDEGARGLVTTPACEKIYRSAGGGATVANTVALAAGARLDWLPQPMIVFDGGRTRRTFTADLAADATLTALEGVILGRTAMAEDVRSGTIHDAWRIRRGGRLIYADAFRSEGDTRAALGGLATLRGARAFATVLHVAPDAAARLDGAREALAGCAGETGASAWNEMLAVRFLAPDGQGLIADLAAFLTAFRAAPLPRSWLC